MLNVIADLTSYDVGFTIDPNSMITAHAIGRTRRTSRRQAHAPASAASEIETEVYAIHHIRPNSRRAVLDRPQRASARELGTVSRKSVLSMRARGSVDSQTPVRGYFLWVGGALLVLLFVANSLLPAPLPSKLIVSHSTFPPIRITSELKGPEAVVIDTSQRDFLPTLPDKEIAAAPWPPLSSDVADAARQPPASLSEQADASDGSPAVSTHVRETLAQLGPGVSDQAGSSRRPVGLASEPHGNFAQTRSKKQRRSARHSSFDATIERCDSPSHGQGSCRYAIMHPLTHR